MGEVDPAGEAGIASRGLPSSERVSDQPWIDWFAHWQAYEIADFLQTAPLFLPPLQGPTARKDLEQTLSNFDSYARRADARIQRAVRVWAERAPTFDWVSRFRTTLGAWNHYGLGPRALRLAALRLVERQGLSERAIADGIRHHLLDTWDEVEQGWKSTLNPCALREMLREDILVAFRLLCMVTGRRMSPVDFDPQKVHPGRLSRLAGVLPFEFDKAKRDLAILAPAYLKQLNPRLPSEIQFAPDDLVERIDRWIHRCPPFARFCLNLARLHRHYAPELDKDRVLLEERTPIDFLHLTAQAAERVLLQRRLKGRRQSSPAFKTLLLDSADRVAGTCQRF